MRAADDDPPGHLPKPEPDTILDDAPELRREVEAFPPASLEVLPELVLALERRVEAARRDPGEWVEGRVLLGERPLEYLPTHSELLASFMGDRLREVIAGAAPAEVEDRLRRAGVEARAVDYLRVEIGHADVVGSGRFFHASPPSSVRLTLVGARG